MTVTLPAVTVAIKIDARLGYRNKGDSENDWKEYARSSEVRNLDCSMDVAWHHYNCSTLPLFDLGSLYHDFYLLNIRLHLKNNTVHIIEEEEIGKRVDLWLLATYQNGGYTQIMVSMKTVFFLIIVLEMIWFWRRVTHLTRPINRLEIMLLVLGAALTLLNLPLEYLTLAFNMPWFSIMDDIKQNVFYAYLFVFWVIFARHINRDGEEETKSAIKRRAWMIFVVVFIVCLFVVPRDTVAAIISFSLYVLFLCYMSRRVFTRSSFSHRTTGTVLRFRILILFTLLTAVITTLDEALDGLHSGPLKTGVYGMWNIYIFSLLFFFAPSHKPGIYEESLTNVEEREEN